MLESGVTGYGTGIAEDAEITRVINALRTTLNDGSLGHFDVARMQEIVNGALGGEHKLTAYAAGATSGELYDKTGARVAQLDYADGSWTVERVPKDRKSEELEAAEKKRSEETEIEYQKPIAGRAAIWKKKLTGD